MAVADTNYTSAVSGTPTKYVITIVSLSIHSDTVGNMFIDYGSMPRCVAHSSHPFKFSTLTKDTDAAADTRTRDANATANINPNYTSMAGGVAYSTHPFRFSTLTKDADAATIINTSHACMVRRVAYSTHTLKSSTLTKDANASSSVLTSNSRYIWVSRLIIIRIRHQKPPVFSTV